MKINKHLFMMSLLFGISVGVIDACVDYLFFYRGQSFWGLLFFDIPRHEIYIRLFILLCFVAFGLIASRLVASRTRAERSLREVQFIFDSFLEKSPVYIFFKDKEIRPIKLSRNYEQMLGMPLEDILGKTMDDLFPSDLAKSMIEDDKRILARGEVETVVEEFGGRIYETTKFPISMDENTRMLAGFTLDITERRQAETALQKVHAELEQRIAARTLELQKTHEQLLHAEKLSAIGKLSASIAHEFNNPLQGVLNIVKGIKRRVSLDQEDSDLVDMAVSECLRMRDLIQSLRDFNRPTSGRKTLVDIHAVLDSLLLLGKKEYKIKKVSIEKKYAQQLSPIQAVADQIKQVFLNLLNNAIDACEGGGTITVETEGQGDKIVVRIHDTGTGITPDDKGHLFEPFFTTKSEIKGTGLGLSVSYGIVKGHGGEIVVDSDQERGTTFAVTLPLDQPS
ncbi:MAG: PAS domain-containing protein [Proteobacteria bacterium]|nr:PAS domain-containing protein [Pseudomonadota bacterium]MBU1714227.1 PAS domain-containing protein [Pseudomonadota bacterium]